ncbi:MAG: CPBP family intramembrane glutamic endopeptidase [Melioribacteraceae bacterium]
MQEDDLKENNSEYKEDENPNPEDNPPPLKSTINPVYAAFFGLFAVFILYQFGGAILTLLIFGADFQKADVNATRLLTMGGQILFILLPALLFTKYFYNDITRVLRAHLPSWKEIAVFTVGLFILTPLLQDIIYIQNYLFDLGAKNFDLLRKFKEMFDQLDKIVEGAYGSLLNANNPVEMVLIIAVVAVTPAICEEVFFRGYVLTSFNQKFKPFFSALVTAFFFAIYHFNPYGSLALILLGLYFGFAAYTSDSIIVPMFLHFLNNFLAILAYFILGSDELLNSNLPDDGVIAPHFISLFFLTVIFFIFIYLLKKNYNKFVTK